MIHACQVRQEIKPHEDQSGVNEKYTSNEPKHIHIEGRENKNKGL